MKQEIAKFKNTKNPNIYDVNHLSPTARQAKLKAINDDLNDYLEKN